jgi:glycosyltransferase involved in cell wall biosynthesis
MRVLILAPPRRDPDQITRFSFVDEEIRGLANAGVEPFVLTSSVERDESIGPVRMLAINRDEIWRKRIRSLGVMARNLDRLPGDCLKHVSGCVHRVRVESAIAQAVRDHDIGLIHSHFGPFVGFGGMLARTETGIPLVATFRGMDLLVDRSIDYGLRRSDFYAAALPPMIETADVTTYATDFMRREGIRLGADPATAITIRKGVDTDHFSVAEDRARLSAELGVQGPMILTVAGLIRRKGVDTIIRALALLKHSHDFTLVVCGRGPEKAALRRLSAELGIEDRVEFRGRVSRDEIPRYFAACDVFVLASRVEAAGNVLLEAMSAGRPVITTESGGPPEYVKDGRTGYVIPVDDHDTLARRVGSLLDDPALCTRLGFEGRRVVTKDHRYEMLIRGYLEAYQHARAATDDDRADAA